MNHLLRLLCALLGASVAVANDSAWVEIAPAGFGDPLDDTVVGFADFGGAYLATTTDFFHGGSIQRSADGGATWVQVGADGLGDPANVALFKGAEFGGMLYLGTFNPATGGEVWRSADGTGWTQVGSDGLGSAANAGVLPGAVFQGRLYAFTSKISGPGEVWSSADGLAWTLAAAPGFGSADNVTIMSGSVFQGALYVSTSNTVSGSEVWRTVDGTTWDRVATGGFGDVSNAQAHLGPTHLDHLYAGTYNPMGAELWRSADGVGWTRVGAGGLGNPSLTVFRPSRYGSELVLSCGSGPSSQLLRSLDGLHFEPITAPGMGSTLNVNVSALGAVDGRLLAGTWNFTTGGELWLWDLQSVGTNFCAANPNSTGAPARLRALGSASVAADCLRLDVEGCPRGTLGLFVLAQSRTDLPFGDGRMCVGPRVRRVLPTFVTDELGAAGFELDLSSDYASGIVVGERTYYQCWYRDRAGVARSNTSDAVAIEHEP